MKGRTGVVTLMALLAALAVCGAAAARVDEAPFAQERAAATAGRALASALARLSPQQPAFAPNVLSQRLAKALAVPNVALATSGAVVVDLATGETLYAQNADRALVPASNEKLAVAYAALLRLGPAFRFRTEALGAGTRVGSTWDGDVYLRGGGDPTLTTAALRRLSAQVRAAGIRRVTGAVLADESSFDARRTAPGWKPSYYLNESPPLSSLVVDRAVFGGKVTGDPAGAAAAVFARTLAAAGVEVDGKSAWGATPADAAPLGLVESAPLAEILRLMDGDSDNFTAELMLKTLGLDVAGKGTTAAGARVVTSVLTDAGIPLTGVRIVDGSGLSRLDRLTPNALASILVAAWNDPEIRPVLRDSLAVAGRSGTLKRRLDRLPAYGAVRAKTGTTAVSSALSGFVRNRFAFSVVQNGSPISTWWARTAQDRFAIALAAQ